MGLLGAGGCALPGRSGLSFLVFVVDALGARLVGVGLVAAVWRPLLGTGLCVLLGTAA